MRWVLKNIYINCCCCFNNFGLFFFFILLGLFFFFLISKCVVVLLHWIFFYFLVALWKGVAQAQRLVGLTPEPALHLSLGWVYWDIVGEWIWGYWQRRERKWGVGSLELAEREFDVLGAWHTHRERERERERVRWWRS